MSKFTLTGQEAKKRGEELKPIRERAYKHFCSNPLLTGGDLRYILLSEGNDVKEGTCYGWISLWRKQEKIKEESNKQTMIINSATPISWEQIIASAPNVETIGVLLLEGFIAKIKEKDDLNGTLKEENRLLQLDLKKLQSEFNERLAKAKIGTLTLDTLQHKLIRKE